MWTPVNLVYTGKAQRARGWVEGRRGGCRACNLPCTRHHNKPKSMQPWHTDSQIPATYPTPAFSAAPGVPQPTEIVIEQTPIPGLRRLLSSFLYSHLFPSLLLGDQGGVQWGHGRQLARSLRLKVSEQGWALSGTGHPARNARGRPALGAAVLARPWRPAITPPLRQATDAGHHCAVLRLQAARLQSPEGGLRCCRAAHRARARETRRLRKATASQPSSDRGLALPSSPLFSSPVSHSLSLSSSRSLHLVTSPAAVWGGM